MRTDRLTIAQEDDLNLVYLHQSVETCWNCSHAITLSRHWRYGMSWCVTPISGRTMVGSWSSFSNMSPSNTEPLGSRNATWFWKAWTQNRRPEHEPYPKTISLATELFQLYLVHQCDCGPCDYYLKKLYCAWLLCLVRTFAFALRSWQPLGCNMLQLCQRVYNAMPQEQSHEKQSTLINSLSCLYSIWMWKCPKDLDTEIAALAFTMRKLWSGLRALWRNSPNTSSSDVVQALKNDMKRKPGSGPRQTEDTSVLQTVQTVWGFIEGDKTGWSRGSTKEYQSHQQK